MRFVYSPYESDDAESTLDKVSAVAPYLIVCGNPAKPSHVIGIRAHHHV